MTLQELNDNPVVQARYFEGYSQERLGKKLGLSKQYISRAEQAHYTSLNRNLLRWTAEANNTSVREVERSYENFQTGRRAATTEDLALQPLSRGKSTRPGHKLFLAWRENYWTSIISFCNAMCVHPSSVENYEEGITPYMPEQVKFALQQVKLLSDDWSENPHCNTYLQLGGNRESGRYAPSSEPHGPRPY